MLMWGFSGQYNLLDSGYAQMDTLFSLAPLLFLVFIPALTMRFADERMDGTFELILTKPISELEIVLAKYFSGLTLVTIAILPTLNIILVFISLVKQLVILIVLGSLVLTLDYSF